MHGYNLYNKLLLHQHVAAICIMKEGHIIKEGQFGAGVERIVYTTSFHLYMGLFRRQQMYEIDV